MCQLWISEVGVAAEKAGLLIPQGEHLVMKASKKYQNVIESDRVWEKLIVKVKGVLKKEYFASTLKRYIVADSAAVQDAMMDLCTDGERWDIYTFP